MVLTNVPYTRSFRFGDERFVYNLIQHDIAYEDMCNMCTFG